MASIASLTTLIRSPRPDGVLVDLQGTGTAWTSGTTFSVSGVAGCSILKKIVNSATYTRLIVVTGTATGTLTVSDGTNTCTVVVAARAMPRWFPGLDPRWSGR